MIEGSVARVLETHWERSVFPIWSWNSPCPVAYQPGNDERTTITLRIDGPIPEWLEKVMRSDNRCVRILP